MKNEATSDGRPIIRADSSRIARTAFRSAAAWTLAVVSAALVVAASNAQTARAPQPGSSQGNTFPNALTTGVPAGWKPVMTRTTDLRVTTPGAVVEDVRLLNASLIIDADNVTVRRVEIQGGRIENTPGRTCRNGLLLEDVSIVRAPGQRTTTEMPPAVGTGGYTARRVKIDGLPEGFRVGGRTFGCAPVIVEDSFARIVSPDACGDWHGDGLQGYDGPALTVRNVTLHLAERDDCGGTAPFFYPADQGNTSVDIDRLLVVGGGFPFRLGMPGSVRALHIKDRSWGYGPIDVKCSVITGWEARIVAIDSNYQPTSVVRAQPCNS